jgi:hypothetical protein
LVLVERRSQREVARLTALARETVAKALASESARKPSPKTHPAATPPAPANTSAAQRLRELAVELGDEGGNTIFATTCASPPLF